MVSRFKIILGVASVVVAAALIACGPSDRRVATSTVDQVKATPTIDNAALNNKLALNGEPTLPPGTDSRVIPTTEPTLQAMTDATRAASATQTIERQRLICGPEEDRDGPIAKEYGPWYSGCQLFGNRWIVRTERILAEFECVPSDDACLAGAEPATPGVWRISPIGGYRIVTFVPPDKLRRFNDGACLSLVTLDFVPREECAAATATPSGR